MNGSDTSSLCFSYDNLTLASRGGNEHMWLVRGHPLKMSKQKGREGYVKSGQMWIWVRGYLSYSEVHKLYQYTNNSFLRNRPVTHFTVL